MIRPIEKSLSMNFLSRTSPNKGIKAFFRRTKLLVVTIVIYIFLSEDLQGLMDFLAVSDSLQC